MVTIVVGVISVVCCGLNVFNVGGLMLMFVFGLTVCGVGELDVVGVVVVLLVLMVVGV